MKIFVNASTTVVGGGAQVAASFIINSLTDVQNEYLYAVSPLVYDHVKEYGKIKYLELIQVSPAKLLKGSDARKELKRLESHFEPDIVFTVFGPAYIKFKTIHLCGIGDGWLTHRNALSVNTLSVYSKYRMLLLLMYKRYWFSKSDYYWTEAEVAQQGFERLMGTAKEHISVIPNSIPGIYKDLNGGNRKIGNEITLLTLAAPYPHKNLNMIPRIANEIRQTDSTKKYKFVVTIPLNSPKLERFMKIVKELDVESMISNLGVVPMRDVPKLFSKIDMLFFPTLLETFSVTYLEAMSMRRAIITSDLDFARNICGEAAEYFSPISIESAVQSIIKVANSQSFYDLLVAKGEAQLKKYPNSLDKFNIHLALILKIIQGESSTKTESFPEA